MLLIGRSAAKQDDIVELRLRGNIRVNVDPQIANGSSGSDTVIPNPNVYLGKLMLSL